HGDGEIYRQGRGGVVRKLRRATVEQTVARVEIRHVRGEAPIIIRGLFQREQRRQRIVPYVRAARARINVAHLRPIVQRGTAAITLTRNVAVVVLRIHRLRQVPLLHLVQAGRGRRPALGLGQGRQQHRRQNRDDRDNDQQLNQRECTRITVLSRDHGTK